MRTVIQSGHQSRVDLIEFHPTKNQLISLGENLKIWDVDSGLLLKSFKSVGYDLKTFAISKDGKFIVAGGADNMLHCFNLLDDSYFAIRHNVNNIPLNYITSVEFIDREIVVSGHVSGQISLFDLTQKKKMKTLSAHSKSAGLSGFSKTVTGLAFIENDKIILSSSLAGDIKLFDTKTLVEIDFKDLHSKGILGTDISAMNTKFLTFTSDSISIGSLQSHERISMFQNPFGNSTLSSVKFDATNENYIYLADYDGNFGKLRRTNTGYILEKAIKRSSPVLSIFSSSNNNLVATGHLDYIPRLLNDKFDVVSEFRGLNVPYKSSDISRDGKTLVIGGGDSSKRNGFLKAVSLDKGELDWNLTSNQEINHVYYLEDSTFALGIEGKKITIFDLETKKRKAVSKSTYDYIVKSYSGSYLAANNLGDGLIELFSTADLLKGNIESFEKLPYRPSEWYGFFTASIDRKDETIFFVSNKIESWNIDTGRKLTNRFPPLNRVATTAITHPTKDILILGNSQGELQLWNYGTFELLDTTTIPTRSRFTKFEFDNEGNLLTASVDKVIRKWKISDATKLELLGVHSNNNLVFDMSRTSSGFVATATNQVEFFKGLSEEPYISFLSPHNTSDYIFFDSKNRYKASKSATDNLIAFNYENSAVPIEYFDNTLNRPDIILAEISKDKNLVDEYEKIVQARKAINGNNQSVLGVKKSNFVTTISNFSPVTNKSYADIYLKSFDEDIRKIIINVKGVPYPTGEGIKVKPFSLIDTVLSIPLSLGINDILINSVDKNNLTSIPKLYKINRVFQTEENKPKVFVLAIGVSDYLDSSLNLKYAKKDAQDIMNFMVNKSGLEIADTLLLLNQKFNRKNLDKIKLWSEKAKIEDVLIAFYSGHGAIKNGNYYLTTNLTKKDNIEDSSINYSRLTSLFDQIGLRNRLFLIDACYSGEYYGNKFNSGAEFLNEELKPNVIISARPKPIIPIAKSENRYFDLAKTYFNEYRSDFGINVISSSKGVEFSYEDNNWKNGLFTYGLLEILQNQEKYFPNQTGIKVSSLSKQVGELVSNLSKGLQNPGSRSVNIRNDFTLRIK
ncbi:caspase family protein [Maribacter sp. 2304DJ31-5]|uniref:caspase family protein n=1 Tax=Maribacter sp. 2304DJ31-5 TaxID=3386273 RepID=UPI0039BCA237